MADNILIWQQQPLQPLNRHGGPVLWWGSGHQDTETLSVVLLSALQSTQWLSESLSVGGGTHVLLPQQVVCSNPVIRPTEASFWPFFIIATVIKHVGDLMARSWFMVLVRISPSEWVDGWKQQHNLLEANISLLCDTFSDDSSTHRT